MNKLEFETNQYVQLTKPWKYVQRKTENKVHVQ